MTPLQLVGKKPDSSAGEKREKFSYYLDGEELEVVLELTAIACINQEKKCPDDRVYRFVEVTGRSEARNAPMRNVHMCAACGTMFRMLEVLDLGGNERDFEKRVQELRRAQKAVEARRMREGRQWYHGLQEKIGLARPDHISDSVGAPYRVSRDDEPPK